MPKKAALNNGQQKAQRQPVDYDRIEPGYRAGVKSVLQLAAEYEKATGQKVSHTAIKKHFDKKGIKRDLADKVQAQAQAKVSAAAVSAKVATETGAATKPTETAIIEANADLVAFVLLSQRTDIKRNRALVMAMLEELETATFNGPKIVEIAESLIGYVEPGDQAAQQRKEKMMDAINRALSLAGRVDSMKKLADTLKVLVGLEREAYGISAVPEGNKGGTLEDFLDELD